MTKEERTASSIAQQFVTAVNRLEAFFGDPDMVYEDMLIHALGAERAGHKKTKQTVTELVATLRGGAE